MSKTVIRTLFIWNYLQKEGNQDQDSLLMGDFNNWDWSVKTLTPTLPGFLNK